MSPKQVHVSFLMCLSPTLTVDLSQHQLELTALKSKTFSQGITKKTKRDLEKEAEERKRIEEEKYTARHTLNPHRPLTWPTSERQHW